MAPMASRKRKMAQDGASDSPKAMATSMVPIPNKDSQTAESSKEVVKRQRKDSDLDGDMENVPRLAPGDATSGVPDGSVTDSLTGGIPGWSLSELEQLIERMMADVPQNDTLKYNSRVERVKWDKVAFGHHSSEECKSAWIEVQKRIRHFRTLNEILEDAKLWLKKPWNNFYRGVKTNRHPEMPRRPLNTCMLFHLDKKDEVCKENPEMEMPQVSKLISQMYRKLPEKEKQMYHEKGIRLREEYQEKLKKFYVDHPDLDPKVQQASVGKAKPQSPPQNRHPDRPRQPLRPYKLFCLDKKDEVCKENPGMDETQVSKHISLMYTNLPENEKKVYQEKAAKMRDEYQQFHGDHPDLNPKAQQASVGKAKPQSPPQNGHHDKPRRPLSTFKLFYLDKRDEVRKENPGMYKPQLSKHIHQMYNNLPENEKKVYHEKAASQKEEYKEKMKQFNM